VGTLRRTGAAWTHYRSAMTTGTVLSLHRWPVKSMGGEAVDVVVFDGRGVAGDRAHVVIERRGDGEERTLTARQAPRLLAWQASYGLPADAELGVDVVPQATVESPDGRRYRWDDPELPSALSSDLGRPLRLERDLELRQDLRRSLLVTVEATREAIGETLGRPLDLRRARTNVHVALDAPAYAEEGWEGARLRIGGATLDLLHPCVRCAIPTRDPETQERWPELLRWLTRTHGGLFGINARTSGPGAIRVGDRVELDA
jgi:uncharacterized protein